MTCLLPSQTANARLPRSHAAPAHAVARSASLQIPCRNVDIVLPDGAPRAGAQYLAELFHSANDLLQNSHYRVRSGSLSSLGAQDAQAVSRRLVIFLGGIQDRWRVSGRDRAKINQLLRRADHAAFVGGAVFLLQETARASENKLAIHPNLQAAAREDGLRTIENGAVFTSDGTVSSAVSSFAAPWMVLRLISEDHGSLTANALEQYLGLSADTNSPDSPVSLKLRQTARGDELINAAIELMQQHMENPLSVDDLAEILGVSPRRLQRRFKDSLGQTPFSTYRQLRLERAHQLLTLTKIPVREVAVAAGFGTYPNLARWFGDTYGLTPCALRRNAYQGLNGMT